MSSRILIKLLPLLLIAAVSGYAASDGPDSNAKTTLIGIQVPDQPWDGIDEQTRARIEAGEIVILNEVEGKKSRKALIRTMLTFNVPLEETWRVLAQVDTQKEYLPRVDYCQLVDEGPRMKNVEFVVDATLIKVRYRVIHRFNPEENFFDWYLDPDFKNELKRVDGFWKLYALSPQKTLARYGTRVNTGRMVPGWLERFFAKRDIPKALDAVRKRVESGGTWKRSD